MNNPLIGNSDIYLKNISIDNVIFGYHEKELKVLLQKPQNFLKWMLPGGYLKKTETLKEAAERIATERTTLKNLFLKQFNSFGSPYRTQDPEFTPKKLGLNAGVQIEENHWMFDYFVSICFYTLTDFEEVTPKGTMYAEECTWWAIDKIPPMLFDHNEIIKSALKSLRLHIYHYPIGYELLGEKFTLPEIRALYETILGKKLDSRNFSKKLTSAGIITKLDEKRNIGAHRSPFLYMFNKENYNEALNNGVAIIV